MDQDEPLGQRGRRALPLIAAALTVIVVASLLYLRATAPEPRGLLQGRGAPPFTTMPNQFTAAVDFISPSLGWAGLVAQLNQADAWVYRTTDGGRHWRKQFTSHPARRPAPWIHFFDLDHGFFYAGDMYSTNDGGAHWTRISLPDATPNFAFASPTRGWATDYANQVHLFSTADGGLTWRMLAASPPIATGGKGSLSTYDFRSNGEGWAGALSQQPTVYLTLDGGATWRSIVMPLSTAPTPPPPGGKPYPPQGPPSYITSVMLLPANGVIVTVAGDFGGDLGFISFDRGGSWRLLNQLPGPRGFSDLSFVDAQHWWASRWNLLFKTSDAGQSWTPAKTVDPDVTGDWTFGPAQVIDAQHAWLWMTSTTPRGGASGLAMTSDGGVHWQPVNVPQPG